MLENFGVLALAEGLVDRNVVYPTGYDEVSLVIGRRIPNFKRFYKVSII